MRRFGRVLRCLAFSVLVGGLAAPPAAGQVQELWFDGPLDGMTWHRGDVIKARIAARDTGDSEKGTLARMRARIR